MRRFSTVPDNKATIMRALPTDYPTTCLRLLGPLTTAGALELAQAVAFQQGQTEPTPAIDRTGPVEQEEIFEALRQGHDHLWFQNGQWPTSVVMAPALWHTLQTLRCPYSWRSQQGKHGWEIDITDDHNVGFTVPLLDHTTPDLHRLNATDPAIIAHTHRWIARALDPRPSFAIINSAHERMAYLAALEANG